MLFRSTFDIDANGIVHVGAKDLGTGKEQSMTISGGSALGRDEIDRMMKDAEAHAEEDRLRREEAEVRNDADSLVYRCEQLLAEQGDKISAEDRATMDGAIASTKEALNGSDVAAIRSAHEALIGEFQAFSTRMYQQAQATSDGAPNGATPPNDDEVAEAEIKIGRAHV